MYHTVGTKYEETKNLDINQVARLIKADVAKAFPLFKVGCSVEKYSMGRTIHITLRHKDGVIIDRESQRAFKNTITTITDWYNFDDSDSMSDYFHVHFYTDIHIA